MQRKNACELDDCRCAGTIVVCARCVGSEVKAVNIADARIVVAANYDNTAGIPSFQPCENIYDVHFRLVGMTRDLDHVGIELDFEAAAALAAVGSQSVEEKPACSTDTARPANGVRHRVTRSKRDKNRIGVTKSRRRDLAEQRRDIGITPQTHRDVDSFSAYGQGLCSGNPDTRGSRAAGECDQEKAAKKLQSHAHHMWKAWRKY